MAIENLSDNKKTGFTIVEAIIAVSILMFGIVLVYGAFASVVVITYNISSRFTAAYLAQEGVEIVKNIRDNNFISAIPWFTGLATSACLAGCMADYKTETYDQLVPYNNALLGLNTDGFYSYDTGGSPTIFKRKITIKQVTGTDDVLSVSVLVMWNYNGQSFSLTDDEYIYDWY